MNWTELLEEDTRGIITKYLVVCTTLDLVEMERRNVSSNDIRTTIFGGLEIYTPYLATVAAYTVAGLGPFSEPVTIWTDAEGIIFFLAFLLYLDLKCKFDISYYNS